MKLRVPLVGFAWMLVTLCTAHAQSTLETLNYARFYAATDPNVFYACQNTNGVACNGWVVAPGTNWTVNYFSQSSANYGVLNDQATVSLTGNNSLGAFPSFESTGARSGYQDTYTIGGGTGSGTIEFIFQVTGTTSSAGGATGSSLFQYVPVVNGQEQFNQQLDYAVVNGTADVFVPFTFNEPDTFTIYFYALAQIFDWEDGSSASADFFDTAILDQIIVLDSQGNVIPDFTIESASGTAYGPNGILTPEPAPFILTLSSIPVLWLLCLRRMVRAAYT